MTAGDVVRMVSQYRWRRTLSDIDAENEADQIRHERRGLIWSRSGDGNTVFKLTLPPDTAAQFLRCIERAEEQLLDAEHETIETSRDTGTTEEALVRPTATQRRADAALAMAESSMTADASGNGPVERFQVVVNIDADVLAEDTAGSATPSCGCKAPLEVDLCGQSPCCVLCARETSVANSRAAQRHAGCRRTILFTGHTAVRPP